MTKIVSTDSHIIEVPDLWTSRIEAEFADRAPRLVQGETAQRWYADDLALFSVAGGADAGVRFEHPEQLRIEASFEDVRPGAYVPEEKLKDMEADGVWGELVYPTCGLHAYNIPDGALLSAICRVYNDWITEFCSGHPDRIKAIAMINLDDVQDGVRELQRAAGMGAAGALVTVFPPEDRPYDQPIYDPFWAAAQEVGIPLSWHISTNRQTAITGALAGGIAPADGGLPKRTPAKESTSTYWVMQSIANAIFAGVFERYPGVKFVILEHEMAWAPHFIRVMDYNYTQRARIPGRLRFKNDALPSDFFHNSVFLSFQEDDLGVQLRSIIGVDNIMWGSDYPHQEGTFPLSQAILDEVFKEVPLVEREKMTSLTAAKLYGFEV